MLSPWMISCDNPVSQAYTSETYGEDRVSFLNFIEKWTSPAGNVFDLPKPADWNLGFDC